MPAPRVIAFYLPQYHPIPENDLWWGKGFTDWTNTTKAKPRFRGHSQPHLPSDLGFYDLRLEETRIAQAELAKAYGITGFCYYHYWFNGKMLLEKPFNEVLKSGKPDFPFCLCWANENWSRRWDGSESSLLMAQNYDDYDEKEHMLWLKNAFFDKRYIRVNGKPLFLVYKADLIPNLSNRISIWRELAKLHGFTDLYICSVKNIRNKLSDEEIMEAGFDALVEFPPNSVILPPRKTMYLGKYYFNALMNKILTAIKLDKKFKLRYVTSVYSYKNLVDQVVNSEKSRFKTFESVMPGWDNTARRRYSSVFQNDSVEIYEKWLNSSIEKVNMYPDEEKIVFINAWNEWAEGCHLEPDIKNGKKFLESTLKVVLQWTPKK